MANTIGNRLGGLREQPTSSSDGTSRRSGRFAKQIGGQPVRPASTPFRSGIDRVVATFDPAELQHVAAQTATRLVALTSGASPD
jgi:hypothetical protein